jgi:hypothetical protein
VPKSLENRLTVVRRFTKKVGVKTRSFVECHCACGNTVTVSSDNFNSGHTRSCGCLKVAVARKNGQQSIKHGDTANGEFAPEYRVHSSLIQRTTNPKHKVYKTYGGAGRTVCEGLRMYTGFLSVVGRRPSDKHSIDRIKNSGGYWCGSCSECLVNKRLMNVRWATPEQQRQNMDDSRLITINGETHCIAEWERKAGLHVDRIRARIKAGWPINESLLQPPKYNSKQATK